MSGGEEYRRRRAEYRQQNPSKGPTFIYRDLHAVRPLFRREEVEGGHRWLPDGFEDFIYDVVLDADELSKLAWRAAHNTTGKAKDGALRVIVRSRTRTPEKKGGDE